MEWSRHLYRSLARRTAGCHHPATLRLGRRWLPDRTHRRRQLRLRPPYAILRRAKSRERSPGENPLRRPPVRCRSRHRRYGLRSDRRFHHPIFRPLELARRPLVPHHLRPFLRRRTSPVRRINRSTRRLPRSFHVLHRRGSRTPLPGTRSLTSAGLSRLRTDRPRILPHLSRARRGGGKRLPLRNPRICPRRLLRLH